MTTIVVEELQTALSQEFETPNRKTISTIKLDLYKHRSPNGTFTLEIEQAGEIIATKDFTSLDIENSTPSTAINFYHGRYNVGLDSPVVINEGTFEVRITSSGYSFSESDYLGWIKPHENIRIESDYNITNDAQNAFGLELWVFV